GDAVGGADEQVIDGGGADGDAALRACDGAGGGVGGGDRLGGRGDERDAEGGHARVARGEGIVVARQRLAGGRVDAGGARVACGGAAGGVVGGHRDRPRRPGRHRGGEAGQRQGRGRRQAGVVDGQRGAIRGGRAFPAVELLGRPCRRLVAEHEPAEVAAGGVE